MHNPLPSTLFFYTMIYIIFILLHLLTFHIIHRLLDPPPWEIYTNRYLFFSYKSEKNEVPVTLSNGSTVPLVEMPTKDEELGEYDPFEHRKLSHPTS